LPLCIRVISTSESWSPKTFPKHFQNQEIEILLFFLKLKFLNVVSKKNKSCFYCSLVFRVGVRTISRFGAPMSNMAIIKLYLLFSPSRACKLDSTDSWFHHVAHADQGQLDLRILITQNISKTFPKPRNWKTFIFFKCKIFNVVSKKK